MLLSTPSDNTLEQQTWKCHLRPIHRWMTRRDISSTIREHPAEVIYSLDYHFFCFRILSLGDLAGAISVSAAGVGLQCG
ncbi:hypothetical protein CAEBREN_14586 [Caenorhabditis brenneri]|uniref:Uncharacterized protein n=1 Tax=Caenorhabditis brenneri TaxID=135651 RepID=G0MAR9_CAEBE|nr:hypothetical protein CAEBREN_14586 [Caenorhabditis brenneri]